MKGRFGWSTLVLLLGTSGHGFAQDAANNNVGPKDNNLPAINVEAPPPPRPTRRAEREGGGESSRNRSAAPRATAPPHVTVNAPTPLPGPSQVPLEKAFDADKVPGTITTVDTSQIARTNSLNITDSLQLYIPSVSVTTVNGNDFSPNVEFRGYVASPVSGTPQGLAVYQNGVRVNEAFGDTMNWDLIPTAAIRSVTMVTNNPAYGLNALGGALNIQMKDGFNYHGAEIDIMGGSYGSMTGRSTAPSKPSTTTVTGCSRNPTSCASMAISATATWTARSTSTWARQRATTAPRAPRRSNCCRRA
jgi:hypothetical protein